MQFNDVLLQPWAFWLVLALLAAILEMVLPGFNWALASVAALLAAVVALAVGWPIQVLVFSLGLIAALILVRPRLIKFLHSESHMPSRSQELVGGRGVVTEAIDGLGTQGRVLMAGQDWSAKSEVAIALGQPIEVQGHDGIVLIVKEL